MSNQISFTGFEAPHEKELAAYNSILSKLQAAANELGANPDNILIKHGKSYSSVWYGSVLSFRIKLRKNARYIEVPAKFMDRIVNNLPEDQCAMSSDSFCKISLSSELAANYSDLLVQILKSTINDLPKEWDCCSRYMECSNAKKCVHPDPAFALGCGYRKTLAAGKIYYGDNRNVD